MGGKQEQGGLQATGLPVKSSIVPSTKYTQYEKIHVVPVPPLPSLGFCFTFLHVTSSPLGYSDTIFWLQFLKLPLGKPSSCRVTSWLYRSKSLIVVFL